MHAYHRVNEDQQDEIRVCGKVSEWGVVVEDLRSALAWDDLEPETREMIDSLYELGVK